MSGNTFTAAEYREMIYALLERIDDSNKLEKILKKIEALYYCS